MKRLGYKRTVSFILGAFLCSLFIACAGGSQGDNLVERPLQELRDVSLEACQWLWLPERFWNLIPLTPVKP